MATNKTCKTCRHFRYVETKAPVELTICGTRDNGEQFYCEENGCCRKWHRMKVTCGSCKYRDSCQVRLEEHNYDVKHECKKWNESWMR